MTHCDNDNGFFIACVNENLDKKYLFGDSALTSRLIAVIIMIVSDSVLL